MIETPQSFVTRQECEKVTYQNGFRRPHGEMEGWRRYSSTTAQGSIWLAFESSGSWLVASDHLGVIEEIGIQTSDTAGPGLARFRFANLAQLYATLPRIYELAASLPDAPLHEFIDRTKNLPKATEAERLVVQRIGQNIFRERLIKYWQGRCPITGIKDKSLLRASHIKPWRDCSDDNERLDVHNGLLLSALWDAAFDKGLVTFNENGAPVFSSALSNTGIQCLQMGARNISLPLTPLHSANISWHREKIFVQ